MKPPIPPLLFSLLLFIGMLVSLEAGRQLGIRCRQKESERERVGLSTIEGAIFALFGLVVAFTFSGAVTRFNEKRMLIAEEVNYIETAYLRVHLLSEEARPELQDLFRKYVDSRTETYRRLPNISGAEEEILHSKQLQEQIWAEAIARSTLPHSHPDAGKLLLPALNNMIDISTTRTMALRVHPPTVIYVLLFGLALICSVLAGYRMAGGRRSWLHILSFALFVVVTVYVILDIEYPRAGLIRLESSDKLLLNIRATLR